MDLLIFESKPVFEREPVCSWFGGSMVKSKRLFSFLLLFFLLLTFSQRAEAATVPGRGLRPVIVIDPGHGGENLGTEENHSYPGGILEKEMDLITAKAMYEELSAFDEVTVYLTREEDQELSLKERAEFASKVKADYLFSIHYNASEDHDQFGAEVWVPYQAPMNAYGYQFGAVLLRDFEEMGLLNCGVKTRLNDKGKDYYGIIRESYAKGIPAFIIEHCHVDEKKDTPFCDSEEDLVLFGKKDAHAVAKFLGLKSSKLGVDYSSHQLTEVDSTITIPITIKDGSAPTLCLLEVLESDPGNCSLKTHILAQDQDSPLLYYAYSLDGGITFSERFPWPQADCLLGTCKDTLEVVLEIPSGMQPHVVFRVFNMYGLYTDSNPYVSDQVFLREEPSEEELGVDVVDAMKEISYGLEQKDQDTVLTWERILFITLASVLLLLCLLGFSCLITAIINHRR